MATGSEEVVKDPVRRENLVLGAVEDSPDGVEFDADGIPRLLFAQHPEIHDLPQLLPADVPIYAPVDDGEGGEIERRAQTAGRNGWRDEKGCTTNM
jgi:hypothetical protein